MGNFAGANREAATTRHLDPARPGIRHTQKLHLHQGAAYGRRHSQGRQGAQRLGVGYWEEETQGGQVRVCDSCIYEVWRWKLEVYDMGIDN